MKPHRIFLVRHAESCGNIDISVYDKQPDYSIRLTENGRNQCPDIAFRLLQREIKKCDIYYSPFFRTRETKDLVIKNLNNKILINKITESPLLREEEWRGSLSKANPELDEEAKNYSIFYYRNPGGESGADVLNRIRLFNDRLDIENEAEDIIIIGHGFTNRIILMDRLGLTVEEFERIKNPKNGEIWELVYSKCADKYHLNGFYETIEPKHNFRY